LNKSKGKAKEIIYNLRIRKLLKRAYRMQLSSMSIADALTRKELAFMTTEKQREKEMEISEITGVSPEDLVLYIQTIPIKGYMETDDVSEASESILVQMRNGDVRQINEISPLTLQWRTVRRLYVFGPPEKEQLAKVREACERLFGVRSDLR
jgi:hypothetical protein